jgi:hypothetical protein
VEHTSPKSSVSFALLGSAPTKAFRKTLVKSGANPPKHFSLLVKNFSVFSSVKLGHFTANEFILCVTNMQAFQQE